MWVLILVTWVDLHSTEYEVAYYVNEQQCIEAVAETAAVDNSSYYKCKFVDYDATTD